MILSLLFFAGFEVVVQNKRQTQLESKHGLAVIMISLKVSLLFFAGFEVVAQSERQTQQESNRGLAVIMIS